MAKYLSLASLLFASFLTISSVFTSTFQMSFDNTISLIKEPEEHYYIIKNKPVEITCQARNTAEIIFSCMAKQIPETSVEIVDVTEIDPSLTQAKIQVTRADVQNYQGEGRFWCTCSAVNINGETVVTSKRGYVLFPHLKRTFKVHPTNTTATVGENVELLCGAPEGVPKPLIRWNKDNERLHLETTSHMLITDLGSLVIKSVTKEDGGLYHCIARNIAGRRVSDGAHLTIMALEESAEPGLTISEGDETNKKPVEVVKPRTTRQSTKTYFIKEPQEKNYVTEDKPALLDCAVVAADILTINCNGKRIPRHQAMTVQGLDSAGNRNVQLQFKVEFAEVESFQKEFGDSKPYQCMCSAYFQLSSSQGWEGLLTNASNGFVYIAYLDNVFISEPSDTTTTLNNDVTMTCKPPKGEPSPQVYWYKDGSRLELRNRYTVNSDGHLVIRSVQNEDAGLYNCVADNSFKSLQSRVARLTIADAVSATTTAAYSSEDIFPDFPEVIPSTPVFLRDLKSEYIIERNGTQTIVCAAMSANQMTIDCGGRRLTPGEYEVKSKIHRETNKRLSHAKTVVSAEQVEQNPDGYFCQCNAWFLNEHNVWGQVFGAQGYFRLTTKRVYIEDNFVVTPKNTNAFWEADVQLVCKPPEGNPTPRVHWLKDGSYIDTNADPNYVIIDEGTLIIEYVRITDEGQYTCVAGNEAGTRSSPPVMLTVLGKPERIAETEKPETSSPKPEMATIYDSDAAKFDLTQPIFSLEPNHENYIIKNQPVILSCTVIAAKTVLFVCNGEVMRETSETSVHSIDPETRSSIHENSLRITKEKVEAHTGSEPYTCVCRAYYEREEMGPGRLNFVDSSPALIQVAYLGNLFFQEPLDTKVANQGRAELLCTPPNGNPEPEVYWVKDGYRITQNERIRVEAGGNLVIDRFSKEDEGQYTCVAENIIRSKTSQTATVSLSEFTDVNPKSTSKPSQEPILDTLPKYTGSPYISKDLLEFYYLTDNKPVTIICEAHDVHHVSFICGMQSVGDQVVRKRVEPMTLPNKQVKMVEIIEASINVSKSEVENYEPGKDYLCRCQARFRLSGRDDDQVLDSSTGVVIIEDNEDNDCAEMLRDCSSHLPDNAHDLEFCISISEYTDCMEDYFTKCSAAVNKDSMNATRMAFLEAQARCSLKPKCPELENCKRKSTNPIHNLTVQSFCSDGNNMIHCMDTALRACNMTSSSDEKFKTNLFDVVRWFIDYCEIMIQSSEIASCDLMNTCNLNIRQMALYDTTTTWCRFIIPLVECTNKAINVCGVDELRNDLEQLYSQSSYLTCSEDNMEEKSNGQSPDLSVETETEPKGESEFQPKGEIVTEGSADNDDNDTNFDKDEDNTRIEKAPPVAKDRSADNGSAILCSSVLVTIVQLIMINLTLR